jgi:hypothetical protein
MWSTVQSKPIKAQKRYLLFIYQKFYFELKKEYFKGSEIQPEVTRAEKREIQISRVNQNFYSKCKIIYF